MVKHCLSWLKTVFYLSWRKVQRRRVDSEQIRQSLKLSVIKSLLKHHGIFSKSHTTTIMVNDNDINKDSVFLSQLSCSTSRHNKTYLFFRWKHTVSVSFPFPCCVNDSAMSTASFTSSKEKRKFCFAANFNNVVPEEIVCGGNLVTQ